MATTNRLSKASIRSLPEGWHSDGHNLYLRVVNNERYWVLRKMRKGVRVVKPLGKYPYVSLAEARNLALAEVYSNRELFAKKETFPKLKDVWGEAVAHLQVLKKWKSDASIKAYTGHYRKYIGPALGDKRTDSITTQDVLNMLKPKWAKQSVTMEHVRSSLCNVFKALVALGKTKGPNPAEWRNNLDAYLPTPSRGVAHYKRADEAELRKLFNTCPDSIDIVALRFGTLTALRVKEFLWITWDEVDFETATLLISPKRRKDKKIVPFRVPLSDQAIALLQGLPKTTNYIFTSEKGKKFPANIAAYWMKSNGFNCTMHGMRSVFMDWGTERSKDPILLEKCLCHATGGAVNQAYQRSDCLEQRRPIMQEWADYLYSLAQNS